MDLALFRLINGLAGQWQALDEFFRFFANDYIVPTVIVALLVVCWFRGEARWRQVVLQALLALLVANAIVKACNFIWFRPRPFTYHDVNMLFYYPSDSSFPSNSAAAVWSMAGAIWLAQRANRLGQVALLLAALMGFSRIWVGVHYPFDIVGGAAVGMIAASLVQRYQVRLRPLVEWLVWLANKLALA